jgi:hypothetical protein
MDRAIYDRVHVISLFVVLLLMLLNMIMIWLIAIGAFSASQHGIVVPCSAGNSGLKVQRITNFLLYKVVNKDGDAEQDAAGSWSRSGRRRLLISFNKMKSSFKT